MSDGFITVAQCVEALPFGRFAWEVLFCAFLAALFLGAINESTPLAFSFVTTSLAPSESQAAAAAAAMALGNMLSNLAGGWLADSYGRMAVVRPAMMMSLACGVLLHMANTEEQGLVVRFLLGLSSGGLLGVLMPLVAELLPSRHRGFYLSMWCTGFPLGSLLAVLSGSFLPGLSWQALNTLALLPVVMLFCFSRFELLPESPRYMYLAGDREGGYDALLDMYDKEALILPWAPESVAVTSAAAKGSKGISSDGVSCLKSLLRSEAAVTVMLGVTSFVLTAAAQAMKLWFPTMLLAHDADRGFESRLHLHSPGSFARGPNAMMLLSLASGHRIFVIPDQRVVLVLSVAFLMQLLGIILSAFLAASLPRRPLVLGASLLALMLSLTTMLVARSSSLLLCGFLLGGQLAAQAVTLNLIHIFACEYFPTTSRAKTMALVAFAGQLGHFGMPFFGGWLVHHFPAWSCLLFFSAFYFVGLLSAMLLPIPLGKDRALNDVAVVRPGSREPRSRKPDMVTYQTI